MATLLIVGPGTTAALAQSPTMRERVYERLSKAQAAAETKDYAKALEILGEVGKMKDLSPYEVAQLQTAYGFVQYSRENYREAIGHYEIALRQEGLPEAMVSLTLYTLAQLHFVSEDYAAAAGELEKWLRAAKTPGPEPYVLLAQAYYKLERYRDGLTALRTAFEIAQGTGRTVQESWYLLMRVLYYELGDWPKVVEVMETLVARYPKKEYWIQLAAAYGEVNDAPNRLASYDAAYLQGFLDRPEDLVGYAQLLVQAGAPYRGAVVLRKGLQDGVVERTERIVRLLSEMWMVAHEEEEAITFLVEAATMSQDGDTYARLAQLRLNRGEIDEAVKAARQALQKGLADQGPVQLVLGMAFFRQERYDDARSAFETAMRSSEVKGMASEWIAYVDREQERLRRMAEGLQP